MYYYHYSFFLSFLALGFLTTKLFMHFSAFGVKNTSLFFLLSANETLTSHQSAQSALIRTHQQEQEETHYFALCSLATRVSFMHCIVYVLHTLTSGIQTKQTPEPFFLSLCRWMLIIAQCSTGKSGKVLKERQVLFEDKASMLRHTNANGRKNAAAKKIEVFILCAWKRLDINFMAIIFTLVDLPLLNGIFQTQQL